MENEINNRRRLVIILVTATVVLFVGLVWLILEIRPWNSLGLLNPPATPTLQGGRDCTYPLAYWRQHPELYPPQVVIGGVVYQERELEALLSDDTRDPAQQIRAQLAVVFLNSLNGAELSSIDTTVYAAYGWLVDHPAGSEVSQDELLAGSQLYDDLLAYNLGLAGIVPCEGALSVTATGTGTQTWTVQVSPTLSPTPTGTATLTPTGQSPTPTGVLISPSRTPIPTTEVPENPHWTPTRTVVPPTHTPTTRPPTDTNTPEPTLPPPLPTDTPTPTNPPEP